MQLIRHAQERLVDHPYVLATFLVGSLANGTWDRESDIDLHCVIDAENAGVEPWRAIAADLFPGSYHGNFPRSDTGEAPNGGYVLTPDLEHIDIVTYRAGEVKSAELHGFYPLTDSTEFRLPSVGSKRLEDFGIPYFPDHAVQVFFYSLYSFKVLMKREEYLLAARNSGNRRDYAYIPLLLAENGIVARHTNKRLRKYLTAEQMAALGRYPVWSADPASLLEVTRMMSDDFIRRAKALAKACGAEWPRRLADYVTAGLRRELGLDLASTHADRE
ncbi:nucleotidyltransferase domain-containing protein [Actinomadura chibensis]|nr:nucleotidyltransferase domain-containing protein [Actinomadura chibensis]